MLHETASPEEFAVHAKSLTRMSAELETLSTLFHGLGLDLEHAMALSWSGVHAAEAKKILTDGIDSETRTNAVLMKEREEIGKELERLTKKAKEAQARATKEWRKAR